MSVRDFFPHGFVAVQRVARLIHEGDLYGIADFDGARVRRVFAGEDVEQGGLARAVRADDAEDGAGRQVEAEVFVEGFVRVAFGKVFGDDDFVAEALARRDVDLCRRVRRSGRGAPCFCCGDLWGCCAPIRVLV